MKFANSPTHSRIAGIAVFSIWSALQAQAAASGTAQARVSLQPFAQQVRQVETTLGYLGEPLAQRDQDAINKAIANTDEAAAIAPLEQVLDKYALAIVEINPESRVKLQPGPAKPELVEAGSRIFLRRTQNRSPDFQFWHVSANF